LKDRFKLERKLGSGGFGEVYLAWDATLKRHVAVKKLHPSRIADTAARAALRKEGTRIAALQHKGITTVHELVEDDDDVFLVMEYVKGTTLRQKLGSMSPGETEPKPLPLEEFLSFALQITEALGAAHEKGIVHQDLKPENILVSEQNEIKICDFGLARAFKKDPAATASLPLLGGTRAYMAPERLHESSMVEADPRSDFFSVGVIFYEMLTGRNPYNDESIATTIDRIRYYNPPPPSEKNPSIPPELDYPVTKLLEKDRRKRPAHASEILFDLQGIAAAVSDQHTATSEFVKHSPHAWHRSIYPPGFRDSSWRLPLIGTVLLFSIALIALFWRISPSFRAEEEETAFSSSAFTQFTDDPGYERSPSLSPDGKIVVYDHEGDIFLRFVDGHNAINLTNDPSIADSHPVFSSDGKRIAFRSERDGGGIFVMGITGESIRRVTRFGYDPSWAPDGNRLVIASQPGDEPANAIGNSEAWIVDVASGQMKQLGNPEMSQAVWSPNGKRIAYWKAKRVGGSLLDRDLWTISADGGSPTPVTNDSAVDWNPVWSPDGEYLYFSSDRGGSMNLWRVRIDERTGKVLRSPEAVTTGGSAARHSLSVSADGKRMLYVEEVQSANIHRIAFNPASESVVGKLESLTHSNKVAAMPAASPDGEFVVFWIGPNQEDIAIMRKDGTDVRMLTDDSFKDRFPRWSPDGSSITFYSDRSGNYEVWSIDPDGSDLRQLTMTRKRATQMAWRPDGQQMVYADDSAHIVRFDPRKSWSEQIPEVVSDELRCAQPTWSISGKLLACTTSLASTGSQSVLVYSFDTRSVLKVVDFGYGVKWLNDSRRLLVSTPEEIYLVDSTSGRHHKVLSVKLDSFATFDVSNDNRWIYLSLQIPESDLWMINSRR
jgi:eukaryotic-like serine/threonine-protein kinase